jgi:hypothetical protein
MQTPLENRRKVATKSPINVFKRKDNIRGIEAKS